MFDFEYLLYSMGIVLKGVPVTLIVSVGTIILAILIGLIIGIITFTKTKILYPIAKIYVSIFRSTPTIAQIFLFYYGLGAVSMVVNRMDPLVAAIIVLSLNSGAYISETVRGGLEGVSTGQKEAGLALGLSKNQVMRQIVVPQGLPAILPSLFNTFINIVKGTSITFMIGVLDIMGMARTEGARSFQYLEIYAAVMIVYWVIIQVLEIIGTWVEKRISYER